MKRVSIIKQESGFVTIVVTVIVMIVVSLISVGFAQLARREQSQALNRQLSSEAYYAAESGINDTINSITSGITLPAADCTSVSNKTMSIGSAEIPGHSGSSSYTCVFVNNSVKSIEYSSVSEAKPKYADITTSSAVSSFVVGWETTNPSTTTSTNVFRPSSACCTFPVHDNWSTPSSITAPVLKVDITDLDYGLSRANLTSNTFTAYLYPITDSSPTGNTVSRESFGNDLDKHRGIILRSACSSSNRSTLNIEQPRMCNETITALSGASKHYFIRVTSIYGPSKVSIVALDGGLNAMNINGAQTVVDVTGKAANVLKREQVRISQTSDNLPTYAIQSVDSICKKLLVTATTVTTNQADPACSIP